MNSMVFNLRLFTLPGESLSLSAFSDKNASIEALSIFSLDITASVSFQMSLPSL